MAEARDLIVVVVARVKRPLAAVPRSDATVGVVQEDAGSWRPHTATAAVLRVPLAAVDGTGACLRIRGERSYTLCTT